MIGKRCLTQLYQCYLKKHSLLKDTSNVSLSFDTIRYSSSPMELDRKYELGNFANDLKPFLKTRKKRKNSFDSKKKNYGEPIIICKKHELNHYCNYTYDKFEIIPLASENWKGHKSVGDSFTINIHSNVNNEVEERCKKRFEEMNIDSQILDILKENKIEFMSEIQEKAIPIVLSGRNSLLAAETGCGKTLAYVLPILEQVLKLKKMTENECNSPFVLILTPSRELTTQIRDVIRLFKPMNITSQQILGGHVRQKLGNPFVTQVDILVSTIGIINKLIHLGLYSLKNLRHVVLDEADALLDDSFNHITTQLLRQFQIRSAPSKISDEGVQLTLVSATMPTSLPDILGEVVNVDSIEKVCTGNLHRVLPNVSQKFLRITRSTKPAYLLQIVKKEYKKKQPIIVFCNKSETCDWVSVFLSENNVKNIKLNGNMKLSERQKKFEEFQNGEVDVLISTSICARGLDTRRVKHVVNYEFPSFISDYIHRCGRTGRLGSDFPGKVTNLISGKNEISLVQKIEKSVRNASELENVNPNIARILAFKNASEFEKKTGIIE
ncbi:hypothetical protein PGB90_010018 [Kerria lacca]